MFYFKEVIEKPYSIPIREKDPELIAMIDFMHKPFISPVLVDNVIHRYVAHCTKKNFLNALSTTNGLKFVKKW
jgi:hypothetical protein